MANTQSKWHHSFITRAYKACRVSGRKEHKKRSFFLSFNSLSKTFTHYFGFWFQDSHSIDELSKILSTFLFFFEAFVSVHRKVTIKAEITNKSKLVKINLNKYSSDSEMHTNQDENQKKWERTRKERDRDYVVRLMKINGWIALYDLFSSHSCCFVGFVYDMDWACISIPSIWFCVFDFVVKTFDYGRRTHSMPRKWEIKYCDIFF